MTHPDNDEILRYALRMTGPGEAFGEGTLSGHISSCPDCSRTLKEITSDIAVISDSAGKADIAPLAVPPLPRFRHRSIRTVFRAAAAVAVILLGGYLTARTGADVTVVPQRFIPPAVAVPAGDFSSCEPVDIAHTPL